MSSQSPPGKPGGPARWTTSQKSGVGTSTTKESRIWYALSHGIINEVYYPSVDNPNTRDIGFVVTSDNNFFSEEKRDTSSTTTTLKEGIPIYIVTSKCKSNKYVLKKTIFSNPYNSTLIQEIEFTPLCKENLRLFVLFAPHIDGYGTDNNGEVKLFKRQVYLGAYRNNIYATLSCEVPFIASSCGYIGVSDGWQELKKYGFLKNQYQRVLKGNIALCGEIDLEKTPNKFNLHLSFGHNFYDATQAALETRYHNMKHLKKKFIEGWEEVIKKSSKYIPKIKKERKLFNSSIMVLNSHLGKMTSGTVIASLSIPWGHVKGDNNIGGYHLIWPRDLVEIAGGFSAAGANEEARLIAHFLASIQEEDGHFSQCLWHNGKPYWTNIQMDETALPVILAGKLKKRKALRWFDPWPMVSRAVTYIAKNGPITPQDRWEEDGGYTPFTLAAEISALLIGADFFEEKGLKKAAKYLRELADFWNSSIERWTYAQNTKLSKKYKIDGYYVRISPKVISCHKTDELIQIKNRPSDQSFKKASEIISCDALALVRFGLREADDPKIVNTCKMIDHLLKTKTKCGDVWHRYNEDGYGEKKNGDPFIKEGIGRGWPLLVGERAHYELAKGNLKEAKRLLKTMIDQSGENYLLPEQIWDSEDIPDKELFNGRPTLGAMPLVWAHAEYLKLVHSIKTGSVFDMPHQTVHRYLKLKKKSSLYCWRSNHKIKHILKGKTLRIEVFEPCKVSYRFAKSKTKGTSQLRDTQIGIYYFDIPTKEAFEDDMIIFNFIGHSKLKSRSFKVLVSK